MHNRQNLKDKWLNQFFKSDQYQIYPIAGDASSRCYERILLDKKHFVFMDCPSSEDNMPEFIKILRSLEKAKTRVPKLYQFDVTNGFALLEDLGETHLTHPLKSATTQQKYLAATQTIIDIQQNYSCVDLPVFDPKSMHQELDLFVHWFLKVHLKQVLCAKTQGLLTSFFNWLCNHITNQPKAFMHRDYHSRNIMVLDKENSFEIALLDFQDARLGPITYDLVSLLKDCYVDLKPSLVHHCMQTFYDKNSIHNIWSFDDFKLAYNLCGLQRHLKCLGIFTRLYHRDNKENYLQYLSRVCNYIILCLEEYKNPDPPMISFKNFFNQIAPKII